MQPKTTRIAALLGLRSDVDPERMALGDMTQAVNVRLDAGGQATRRSGRTLLSAGDTHSLFSSGNTTLCVRAGYLQRINDDNSLTPLTPVSGASVAYVAVEGSIYWTDGVVNGVVEWGMNRSWGLEIPQPSRYAEVWASGNLPPGSYQWALTFSRADGQESGASVAHTFDLPDGGGFSVLAPMSSDPAVVMATLYLSTANGTTLYRAATMSPGEAGAYSGNGSDLTSPLLTQHLQRAMSGETLAWMAGRIWVGAGPVLFPSGPFSHELFDLREYLPIPGNITMLAANTAADGLFVGTDQGTFYLTGGDPATMSLTTKTVQPVIAGSLCYVPGNLFGEGQFKGADIPVWACATGIQAGLPGGTVDDLTENRYPLDLSGRGASHFDKAQRTFVLSAG